MGVSQIWLLPHLLLGLVLHACRMGIVCFLGLVDDMRMHVC